MDLLDTVLRASGAESYVDDFRKRKIDARTLPLLNGEDLQLIGIDNEDTRKSILQKSSNLQMSREKFLDIPITEEYVDLILNQISHQLFLHNACLTCALQRKDVVVCNIHLENASSGLVKCIQSFEEQFEEFGKKKIDVPKGTKKERNLIRNVVVGVGAVTIVIVTTTLAIKAFLKYVK